MEALVIFVTFLALMALGVPIGTSLGVAAVITVYYFDLGIAMLGVNFSSGIASFPLLAIPFFVLAGVILEKAGLAATIAHFFELLVGKAVGGLAMVAVMTCMFWGALSGSGPATTAAVGLILLAPMIKHGYDKHFAGATIANASDLSIIIPPSIAFIIYGNITSVSVSALFVAGIIPGLLTGAGTILVAYLVSRKRGYRGLERRGTPREILKAFKESIWAILAPVIILGGIYAGIFTPTEAAVVAVFYSLFVAVVIYRSVTWRDMIRMLVDASVTSSVIMFIVVFAGLFTWAASVIGVIDQAANFVISISPNAAVKRQGQDVTLICYGSGYYLCEEAAAELDGMKIEAEIVDLRTLKPLDMNTVSESIKKTHRAVIVHEACLTGGFGAELAARIQEELFDYLKAPVKRVAAKDIPIPFSPPLEDYVLPKVSDVVEAAREVVNRYRKGHN